MMLLLLVAIVCAPSGRSENTYTWESGNTSVHIRIDRCEMKDASLNSLTALDPSGKELLRIEGGTDGEQFILGEPFRIPPQRGTRNNEGTLFLTEWSSGMSYRLIPLRASGAYVHKLDAIQSDSSDFAILDVDRDGYPEICVWQYHHLGEHLPVATAPMDLVVYKWNGKTFVERRRIRQVDLTERLWQRR